LRYQQRKNPDYRGCFGCLLVKKSPDRRFFGVLRAKRDKLLGGNQLKSTKDNPMKGNGVKNDGKSAA
jgi:hypothetical protein